MPPAEDQRDRAVCSNASLTDPWRRRQAFTCRQTDLKLWQVDPAGGCIAGLDRARVALDVARIPVLVQVIERQSAMPAERLAEGADMPSRYRMINAQQGRGARPIPVPVCTLVCAATKRPWSNRPCTCA